MSMFRLLAAGLALAALLPAAAFALPSGAAGRRSSEPERVRINGEAQLTGLLFKPAGPGPFPAVVALHGCGGLLDRDGQPAAREMEWGQKLSSEGFVVLFPDSFSARGIGPQCRVRERSVKTSRERRNDAHGARRWLQQQAFVKPKAVSLMGWSNGGTTVLYAVRRERLKRPGRGLRITGTDFARAVALYPGCKFIGDQGQYSPRMPLLIAIGSADDWVSPKACEQLAHESEEAAGPKVTVITYPGAYHDFDAPNRPVRTVKGLPSPRGGTREAHVGTDAAARADIFGRVSAFLAR